MKRIYTKIGDIFLFKSETLGNKYFQFVASDLTQLNSDVIRAFKRVYSPEESPELAEIVKGEVDFYAHCVTKWGIQMGLWQKVGNIKEVGKVEVLFRFCNDWGSSKKISYDWEVWRINEKRRYVGRLVGEDRLAEIGSVLAPDNIVNRLLYGKYLFEPMGFE